MKIWPSNTRSRLVNLENEISSLRSQTQNSGSGSGEESHLDPDFYIAFEDRFRGPFDEIKERVSVYIDDLSHLSNSKRRVVDIGCGRGELLTVLKGSNINAIGVDSNPSSISSLKERGFEAYCEDICSFLRRTPDNSLAAVVMLHVVEHLHFDVLLSTFREIFRVLEPGGVFIAETPNSLNLTVGASTFWIDPTHHKPLHPEVISFLANYCGFAKSEIRFLNGEVSTAYDVCMVAEKDH